MNNILKRTRSRVATMVVFSLFALPALSVAGERCDNSSSRNRGSRQAYNGRGDYGNYRNAAAYRNDQYRNRTYRNETYRNGDYAYRDSGYYSDGDYRETRSTAKSAAIIGGGAAAGAVIGGLAAGGKGAAIGAAIGGVGGLIYDRKTRNNGDRW